jgi:hypothetical protein
VSLTLRVCGGARGIEGRARQRLAGRGDDVLKRVPLPVCLICGSLKSTSGNAEVVETRHFTHERLRDGVRRDEPWDMAAEPPFPEGHFRALRPVAVVERPRLA